MSTISAASVIGKGGGGGGNIPLGGAVHFNGSTSLNSVSGFSAANATVFSFAGWLNTNWAVQDGQVVWVVDPDGDYSASMIGVNNPTGDFQGGASSLSWSAPTGFADSHWQQFTLSVSTLPSPDQLFKVYINRVDCTSITHHSAGGFTIPINGLPLWIGDDDSGGVDRWTGDMCDLSFWPGVSFLNGSGDIPTSTLDLFIDSGGNRVTPSAAINAFGKPAFLLTGDTSTFLLNAHGTDGAMTTNAGSLTNASSTPP